MQAKLVPSLIYLVKPFILLGNQIFLASGPSCESKAYFEDYDNPHVDWKLCNRRGIESQHEAQALDPLVFLPQRNPALVIREASKDLHARSENAMDVLDSHKSMTATSIARICTM